MNRDDTSAEDVSGLFRKFGGDSQAYKEFAPPEPTGADGRAAWPLLSGGRIERAPEPAAPAPRVAPQPQPPQPVAAPATAVPPPPPAPAFASVPAPSATPPMQAMPPAEPRTRTELEALFARLASPQPPQPAPGPMSRWRRPT